MATVTCKGIDTFLDGSTQKTYVCLQGSWSPSVEDCIGEFCVRVPALMRLLHINGHDGSH